MNFNFGALQGLNLAKANRVQNTLAIAPLAVLMDIMHATHVNAAPATCTANAVGGANPATIWNPALTGWNLTIDVSRWFFRSYSVGYQVGLFCHEASAHYMTDDIILQGDGSYRGNTSHAHAPGNSEQGIIAAGGIIQDTITTVPNNPGAAAQSDHIFATSSPYQRFLTYRLSMRDFGTAMEGVPVAMALAPADYLDLVDCWLMDVASLIATADNRVVGVARAGAVAQAYNLHRAALQNTFPLPVAGAGPPTATVAAIHATPIKTAGAVRMAYLRMLAGMIWRYLW